MENKLETILDQLNQGAIPQEEALSQIESLGAALPETHQLIARPSSKQGTAASLHTALRETAGAILGLTPDAIGIHQNLSAFGFDSITLAQWAQAIQSVFPFVEAGPEVFLEHATIEELAAFWMQQHGTQDFASQEVSTPSRPSHAQADLLTDLMGIIEEIVGLEPGQVDPDTNLSAYGFDSITLAQLSDRMRHQFQLPELEPSVFLDHATADQLATFLHSCGPVSQPAKKSYEPAFFQPMKEKSPREEAPPKADTSGIAVIGMGGRFPQDRDIAGLWQALMEDQSLITEVPENRWDWRALYGDPQKEPGKTDCRYGGFMHRIDQFDADLFGISAREALQMDPQQRIILQTAWETIACAGYPGDGLQTQKVGVFLGVQRSENLFHYLQKEEATEPYLNTGNTHSMLANRVSYYFGLRGPSMAIDTACSSSGVALHQAIQSIQSGESALALAGGVTLVLHPYSFITNRRMGLLTKGTEIRSFDKDAEGHLIGEGAAMVLLKPYATALRDNDPIFGVIKGSAIGQSGRTMFLTAPDTQSHVDAIEGALQKAGWSSSDLDYLEAQGTANTLADQTELRAYKQVFGAEKRNLKLAIGCIKGHTGHLESASGVTALIKVLLAMQKATMPPLLHFQNLVDSQLPQTLPFEMVASQRPWPRRTSRDGQEIPRRGAIHNFGYGGSYVHLVVEEGPRRASSATQDPKALVFPFSAPSKQQLVALVTQFSAWLTDEKRRLIGEFTPQDIAFTLQVGRKSWPFRALVGAENSSDLIRHLAQLGSILDEEHHAPNHFSVGVARSSLSESVAAWLDGTLTTFPHQNLQGNRIPLPPLVFAKTSFPLFALPSEQQTQPISPSSNIPVDFEPLKPNKTAELKQANEALHDLETLTRALLWQTFENMGALPKANQTLSLATCRQRLKLHPRHERLFHSLVDLLVRQQYLIPEGETLRSTGEKPPQQPSQPPQFLECHARLLRHCLENYPALLKGEIPATQVLFPRGDFDLVAGIYQGHPIADFFNQSVTQAVLAYLDQHPAPSQPISILEVGAGTGATTALVLEALKPHTARVEYHFSDLSKGFIQRARQQFSTDFPLTRFHQLDLEQHPRSQGFVESTYDLIIASNVLHATSLMTKTTSHLHHLLKDHGWLIVNEATGVSDFLTVTFGLLDGWWLYEDPDLRLQHAPLLAPETWGQLLGGHQFVQFQAWQGPENLDWDPGQHLMIAKKQAAQAEPKTPGLLTQSANAVLPKLKAILAKSLHREAHEINPDLAFSQYGIDSFLATELIDQINEQLGLTLRRTDFFNFPSLAALALYVAKQETPGPAQENEAFPSPRTSPNSGSARVPSKPTDIAVIGMAARFPGAPDIDAFWQLLESGGCAIREVPPGRWPMASFYDSNPGKDASSVGKWGGFLEDIYDFDPLFFNISPTEAALMDPQQRLFLQEAWHALEHAGYAHAGIGGTACSVFVGCREGDYFRGPEGYDANAYTGMGGHNAILAARISYFLNLKGPSMAIDTACSSSAVAIHLACESLRSGQSHMALAGGIALMTQPETHIVLSKTGMLAPDGKCKTFDDAADGFVPGEGVGVVVLKPRELAERDGDTIYGIIRGSGINQDGKTNGITASSAPSQASLQKAVFAQFNLDPETISYVEAHGTGTHLGDPIEIQALTESFASKNKQFCAIGSVKTNIGHSLAAAGVAGLIKTLLCLKNQRLVPSLHLNQENREIPFAESPFYVNQTSQPWQSTGPRRALLNSFGFSGTNAHLIVEEAPTLQARPSVEERAYLLVFSAHDSQALKRVLHQFNGYLEAHPELHLGNLAYTLLCRRDHHFCRFACVVSDAQALMAVLTDWLADSNASSAGFNHTLTQKALQQPQPMLRELADYLLVQWEKANSQNSPQAQHLEALAELFTKGIAFDGQRLYPSHQYQATALPPYPFSKTAYHLPHKANRDRQVALPFIDDMLLEESLGTGLVFGKTLRHRDALLQDHQVMGRRIFPGVAHLEMALSAYTKAFGSASTTLERVTWLRPLCLDHGEKTVRLQLQGDKNRCEFRIYSLREGEQLLHSQGFFAGESRPSPAFEKLDIQAVIKRCPNRIEQNTLYSQLKHAGVVHGPSMQALRWVVGNHQEALGRLEIPEIRHHRSQSHLLEPCLLDGALQVIAGLEKLVLVVKTTS